MLACLLAISILLPSATKEQKIENEEPIIYEGGQYGVFTTASVLVKDNHRNTIVWGDSLSDRIRIENERIEREKREVLARERTRKSQSYPTDSYEIIGTFYDPSQCVPYAWSQGMQTRGYHLAKYYPVQSTPTRFASTYEGYSGHIVVVEEDLGEKLVVRDAGFRYGYITRRIINKSLVKGYVR